MFVCEREGDMERKRSRVFPLRPISPSSATRVCSCANGGSGSCLFFPALKRPPLSHSTTQSTTQQPYQHSPRVLRTRPYLSSRAAPSPEPDPLWPRHVHQPR